MTYEHFLLVESLGLSSFEDIFELKYNNNGITQNGDTKITALRGCKQKRI